MAFAFEFDQSRLFQKVCEEEYGVPYREPYGLLVADYEFGHKSVDVEMLKLLSGVAASSHAPLVANARADMFKMGRYTELNAPRELNRIFQGEEYKAWHSFRDSEDSRYVALTLPHVLGRAPYGEEFQKVHEFPFEEFIDGRAHDKYLWTGAAWAYAAVVADAFSRYGWMARIRGVEGGGKVDGLPVLTAPTTGGVAVEQGPCEIALDDIQECHLSNLGFLPLMQSKGNGFAVFFSAQSCNKPKRYVEPVADAADQVSAKLNYLLCASRFVHYMKTMVGAWMSNFMYCGSDEYGRRFLQWINDYVFAGPEDASEESMAKRPLRDARIEMVPLRGKPGWYEARVWLRPHFQLETLTATMRLVAEVGPMR